MKSVIRAVFTLTLFTVVERALGFVFKIYLSRELGAAAIGVYQVALSFFFVLLTLVTSGIPLIVSKLTAKYRAEKNPYGEYGTASAALIINVTAAVLICLITVALNQLIAGLFASKTSMAVLLIMLPAVLFSAVYSALRGNIWGKERYIAVSLVEVLEQVARIAVCVTLFYLGFDKLKSTAAAMTVSCALSCISCVICFFAMKGKLGNPKGKIVPLLKSSTPITMVRTSSSVINSLVALAVPFLLTLQGLSNEQAMYVFGSSVGMAMPLLYIPITVVGSLAFVMIPTLSTAVAKGNDKSVKSQIENAISFAITVAALFVPTFFVMGEPIGALVYDNLDSGKFLSVSAWLLIPVAVENITSSMMNSLDLEKVSFVNYFAGSAVLFIILFSFIFHFDIVVYSVGTGISLTLSSALDIWFIKRKTGIKIRSFMGTLIKSIGLILPAIVLNKAFYNVFFFMPPIFRIGCTALISLIFMIGLNLVFGTLSVEKFRLKRKRQKKQLRSKAAG